MKKYKVTIYNDEYPLSATYNTISDVYKSLCTIKSWASGHVFFCEDDLMVALVQMRKNEVSAIKCNGYSITVLEEAERDADLD